MPEHHFPYEPKFRTRVKSNTLFPIFDEVFDFILPMKRATLVNCNWFGDAFLLISVKDRIMGNGIFIGEALLPLKDMAITENEAELHHLPQIFLPLTRPSNIGDESVYFNALKSRRKNTRAKNFVQREIKKYI